MFGFKTNYVSTKGAYTFDEMWDILKDCHFSAGVPERVKTLNYEVIAFPAQDNNNQIQILSAKGPKWKSNKWMVRKDVAAGNSNLVVNSVISSVTGGLSDLGRMFGNSANDCKKLLETTIEEFKALNL